MLHASQKEEFMIGLAEDLERQHQLDISVQEYSVVIAELDDEEEEINRACNLSYDDYLTQTTQVAELVEYEEQSDVNTACHDDDITATSFEQETFAVIPLMASVSVPESVPVSVVPCIPAAASILGDEDCEGIVSEMADIRPLVELLHDFALQVTKKDGNLYPPESLQNMIRAVGRIIRLQQEIRLQKTFGTEPPFDIMKHPRFRRVKFAGTESVRHSFQRGLGTITSTSDVLTREEEIQILMSEAAFLDSRGGVILRLLYHFCRNMFIWGQNELRATHSGQFEIFTVDGVEILRYKPTLSKTYKFDINHCSKHSLRRFIDVADADVIKTYKTMAFHWPTFTTSELVARYGGNPHPIFLMAKPKFSPKDKVWFQKRAVGKRTLGKDIKILV